MQNWDVFYLFNRNLSSHILQFFSGTFPLNVVFLSHNTLSFFLKLQTSLFPFISHITLKLCVLWTATPFSGWNCLTFLRECHTYILVFSLLLSGPFGSQLTYFCSYFWGTTTPHIWSENSACPTSFLLFGNIKNLFIYIFYTTFYLSNVTIHLQWLDPFLLVFAIYLEGQFRCYYFIKLRFSILPTLLNLL